MTAINSDKHPANYCSFFAIRDCGFLFNFVVGILVKRVVRISIIDDT